MKIPITIIQFQIIRRMASCQWFTPYKLQCSIATLNALVRKGIVERKNEIGCSFFPRTNTNFRLKSKYKNTRITESYIVGDIK